MLLVGDVGYKIYSLRFTLDQFHKYSLGRLYLNEYVPLNQKTRPNGKVEIDRPDGLIIIIQFLRLGVVCANV